jgi:hypothetical protein
MRIGLLVLAFFAAAWASMALVLLHHGPGWIALPIALSLALTVWGWRSTGMIASRGPHVGKLVGRWSAIEVAGIIIAGNVLHYFHRDDLTVPAAVAIVGLHFFPLARGIPVRLYHATGAALLAVAIGALLFPAADRPVVACIGAALVLWATVLVATLRARREWTTSPA